MALVAIWAIRALRKFSPCQTNLMPRASTVVTVVGVTAAVGVIGYAIWFDQKRRHDAEFRRQLSTCLSPSCHILWVPAFVKNSSSSGSD